MSLFRYISHARVIQDPEVPVPQWSLSDDGVRTTEAMLSAPWVADIGRVVCSAETKARMGAQILADHLGLDVEVRSDSGETDRSATGYVSHERHEALAKRFFADPTTSADGWETAEAAQRRVVQALADLLIEPGKSSGAGHDGADGQPDARPDIAVVGHGGVGTLLRCHLAGLAIDQVHDQPGQGHFWTMDRATGSVLHGWLPVDGVPQS